MFFFQLPFLPEWFLSLTDYGFVRGAFQSKKMGLQKQSLSDEDMDAFIYSISQPGSLTATINYYRAAFRFIVPSEYRRNIKVPTLIIWGTKDGALNTEMAELSCKFIDSTSTVEYVEGASHWVQQDAPDVVNHHIAKFTSEFVVNDSKL